MIRLLLSIVLTTLLFSSCTMILSTNIPGKPEKSLPKEWWGKYQVVSESKMPERKDSAKSDKEYAIIESTRITWRTSDGDKVYSLDDSLRYSVIYGQSRYISLLLPQGVYAIFKVVKKADTLELYSLSSDDEPKKSDLNKYFTKVEKIKKGEDEYYRVTIIEKKLEAYFKSAIPSKEPTKLVLVK